MKTSNTTTNKKPPGIIKQIQQMLNLSATERVLIQWETSYHYETKSSRKRGGYNRTRASYYIFQDNQYSKKDLFIDSLTGKFFQDAENYLIPVPDYFLNHPDYDFSLRNMRTGEEMPLKKIKGFLFFGSHESALFLGQFSSKEVKKFTSDLFGSYATLDCKIPNWRVFFPGQVVNGVNFKDLFTPYRKIVIHDQKIIQDSIVKCSFDIEQSEFRLIQDPKLNLNLA